MTPPTPELILNVDDNEIARYAKSRSLRTAGFRIQEARSGQEALQLVRAHRPDLVLLDVKLPDVSGLEVCQIIKREFPTILVLQVSASFVTAGDRTIGLDSGADSYLTQPVEAEELIAATRALLRMRRAEQAAREINERYRIIVDSASDYAIITMDLAGTITSWSAGAGHVLGYDAGEIVGRPVSILFTSDDQAAGIPAAEMAEALRSGRAAGDRWQVRRGGGLLWASGQIVPLRDVAGDVNGFLQILRDRTREKQEEEQLRLFNEELEREVGARTLQLSEANAALRHQIEERERAEKALRQSQKMEAVGQLTGGIAHDFNNLLTVIIGCADVLTRRLPPEAADLNRQAVMVLEAGRRAATLTHRLLAFSRQQPLDPQPTDLSRLVNGMSEILRRTLGEQIEVVTKAAGEPWLVSVDRNQLENALLNLALNSRDAMPGGGRLTIETTNVEQAGRDGRPQQMVRLAVTDSGSGMPPDVLTRAFDPFFTTKGVGQGTGLGLSQVYGFVTQSGGDVEIDSAPGKGTVIGILLPRIAEGPGPAPRASRSDTSPPLAPTGRTILVVEDESVVRQFSSQALREMGFTVVEAADGATALDILAGRSDVSMLFADVGLPGRMNGRQLADEVRRLRPDIKILLTTGYTQNAIVHDGKLDAGVNLLTKPFTAADLAAKVGQVLGT
jgi:PAS domain S-box-containing protein